LLNQRASQDITQARADAGRGTQLDVERARTLTANTEAALPSLEASIDLTIYRLATLSAQPPAELRARLIVPAALPNLPVTDLASLPSGTPAQWNARAGQLGHL
jgi:multidrug efflux system outer membrane protein